MLHQLLHMNNNSLKKQLSLAATFAALVIGSSQVAQAQVFFGETLGAGESSRVAANAATLAAQFAIDIRSVDFWRTSLDIIRGDIDLFERLIAEH